MNVNGISPVSCKSNIMKNAKQITAPLKDGNTLRFTFGDNYAGKGIAVTEVFKMAESFKPHIKEGFDFLKEFKAAILK